MSDKDLSRFDPIVPERDDIPARKAAAGARKGTTPETRSRGTAPAGNGGGLWRAVAGLALVAVIGLGAFSWQQYQQLTNLDQRFEELRSRIESTDESLSQSGAALSVKIQDQQKKLDEHWTEIKKLWGVSYDTNRKAIEANKQAVESQAADIKTLKQSLAGMKQDIAKANQAVTAARSNSLAVSAQVEDLAEKVAAANSAVARIENSLKQQNNNLAGKVAEHDEAIRAIDSYRQQVNEQLVQIRRQLGMQ